MPKISNSPTNLFKEHSPELIAHKRSTPGVAVLNKNLEIAYCNKEAIDILSNLSSSDTLFEKNTNKLNLPERLLDLCRNFFSDIDCAKRSNLNLSPLVFEDKSKKLFYSFRTIPLGLDDNPGVESNPYLLILIEKINYQANWAELLKLTNREKEVTSLLLMGFTNKEIADKLFICTYTVEDHIKNIMRKMDVKNRVSLVLKVLNIVY